MTDDSPTDRADESSNARDESAATPSDERPTDRGRGSDGEGRVERDADRSAGRDSDDADGRDADPAAASDGSVAEDALSLTAALVGISVRILWTGIRIAARSLSDAEPERRWRRRLLLESDRHAIVGAFVAGIFGLALLLGLSDVIGVRESRFVTTMFSTMIAGLFSFIPIVVAVNQLIISRLFGTPDRLTERIDGVQAFRRRVEGQTEGDGVSPTDPAPFLARLAGTLGSRAGELVTACGGGESSSGPGDDADDENAALGAQPPRHPAASTDATASICGFASRTREHAEALSARLGGDVSSVFDVVLPTIDHDYAGAANEARRLEKRFDAELSDQHSALLGELRELFVTADATRQYFTTIYLQRELARLSRLITYSGTAAILLSSLVIMIYASGYPPVAFEGWLLVLVSLALAVAFSPLAVLFAYVVRVSTILRRTSAPGAFTPSSEYHRTNAAGSDGESAADPDSGPSASDGGKRADASSDDGRGPEASER